LLAQGIFGGLKSLQLMDQPADTSKQGNLAQGATPSGELSALPIAAWQSDASGLIRDLNSNAQSMLGLEKGEASEDWLSFVTPSERDEVRRSIESHVASQKPWRLNYIIDHPQMGKVHIRETGEPWLNEKNQLFGFVGIFEDVSPLMELEEEYAYLNAIFSDCYEAIYAVDTKGIVTHWNKGAQRLYGETAAQIIGTSIFDRGKKEHGEQIRERFKSVMAGNPMARIDTQHCRLDGTLINIEVSASAVRGKSGEVAGAVVLSHDISTRLEAQKQLTQSEERYALAAEGSNDGLWDWDLKGNELYLSPRWKEMLGYTNDEIGHTPDHWFSLIVSTDISQFQADLAIHLSGQSSHFTTETRMNCKDGTIRWVLVRGKAVRDEHGQPTRIAGSITDITEQKQNAEKLRRSVMHDVLTGLPNRWMLNRLVEKIIIHKRRYSDKHYAVMFIDLDRFKAINDGLGHAAGDHVLITIANRLRQSLRGNDHAARLGGDEFVVVLEHLNESADAMTVANRLIERVSEPIVFEDREHQIGASIGVVSDESAYATAEELLRDADAAMYAAKQSGRGCAVHFDKKLREASASKRRLETDLKEAVEKGDIFVQYQPIVSLIDGKLLSFEALARWHHPELGMVRPDIFIEIAEETGCINKLGEHVLKLACQQLRVWRERYDPNLTVAVNVSKSQLALSTIAQSVESIIKEQGLPLSAITLEITESTIMGNHSGVVTALNQLHDLGMRLAMDDFGTGHSSLSCLHRFPIDIVKIDRSFVLNMGERPKFVAVVHAIVSLAQTLGYRVVAEGIEDKEQLISLQTLDCDSGQGYFFAKPLTIEDAETYLQEMYPSAYRQSA